MGPIAVLLAVSVVHVFSSDHSLLRVMPLEDAGKPAAGETWIVQDDHGTATPFEQRASALAAAKTHRVTLRVVSAATGRPIRGAAVWQCSNGCRTPILAESTLRTNESGSLELDVSGDELRIWAPDHEWTAIAAPTGGHLAAALWPGRTAIVKTAADVEIEYTVPKLRGAPVSWLRAKSNKAGEIRLPGIGAEKVRVEIVDPRYAFTSTVVDGGTNDIALTPGTTLAGTVVDDASKPLAGTAVEAFLPHGDGLPPRVVRTEAKDDGAFALPGLPPNSVLVRFSKRGFMTVQRWIDTKNAAPQRQVLRPGRGVNVAVAAAGAPVAGAIIRSMRSGRTWKTDAAGRAALTGLDPREAEIVRVETENYHIKEVTIDAASKSPLSIALESGMGVRFRLLSADDGRPIPNITVDAHQGGGTSLRDLAADAGDYVVTALRSGHAKIRLHAEGFLAAELEADPNDPPIDLGTIFLSRGARVRGQLVRAADGKPLTGARLAAIEDLGLGMIAARELGSAPSISSAEDGSFELSGLGPGIPCVTIDHPLVGRSALAIGRIEADAVRDLGVVSRGERAVVRGRVERSDGSPAAGMTVELRSGAMRNPCTRERAVTADDGGFTFRAEAGDYHVVALRDHAIVGHCAARVVAASAGSDCVIRLSVQRVAGTVTIGDARPAGGSVRIRRAEDAEITPTPVYMVRRGIDGTAHQELVSDVPNAPVFFVGSDGAFEGEASLEEGAHRLTYRTADTRSTFVAEQMLSAAGDKVRIDLRFSGRTLSGRITDRDHTPAGGAIVTLWRGTLPLRQTMSSSDGSFRLDAVPAGSYLLEAARRDRRARKQVLVEQKDIDDLDLILTTSPSASLTVRIAAPSGGSWAVYATDGGFTRSAMRTGADDAAVFEGLPPGTYRLLLASPGGAIYDGGSAMITAFTPSTITFSAPSTSAVAVQVPERLAGKAAILLTSDNVAATPLLAAQGRLLIVSDAGVLRLPPLSVGDWALRIDGDPVVHRIAIERRNATIDLR